MRRALFFVVQSVDVERADRCRKIGANLRVRCFSEPELRQWAEHLYSAPASFTLRQLSEHLDKYGWAVLAHEATPYVPGIQFVSP